MKKGQFVIGEHADNLKLTDDKILFRLIDVKYQGKKKATIFTPDGENANEHPDMINIEDFGGYHPSIAEVIAAGGECKVLKKGDVAIVSKRVVGMLHPKAIGDQRNPIEIIYIDKEVLYLAHEGDFVGVIPTYRDAVSEGKIIKKYDEIDLSNIKK